MLQHTDYTIKQEIGKGGMATVYLAYDQVFKCDVAIKILNKEFLFNTHVRNRFLDEARKIYRMNHPNIIRVTRIIEEQENVGFVMEYFDAITLKDLIEQKGKLPEDQIIRLMVQMLDALKYVHQQSLVHRDVKPSNFMVDRNGNLKLLDFGIAKNSDPDSAEYTQTAASFQMGTPMYMSPEQINESRNVTAQSDIYSLGVVLWYLVMGERPYDTSSLSTFQLLSKIVNEKLKDTLSVFQPIISRCTSKDLSIRYEDCDQIKNEILLIDPKVQTQPLPGKLYEDSLPKKNTTKTDSTRIVNFEKAVKKTSNNGFFKKPKIVIISITILLLIISSGILILTHKKENKKETTETPVIKIDTLITVSNLPDTSTQQIVIDSSGFINEKKLDKISVQSKVSSNTKSKTSKTLNNKKVVDNTSTDQKETSIQNVQPITNTPSTTTSITKTVTPVPTPEEPEKEKKFKKTVNKVKDKIKGVFKKKDKE